MGGGLCSTMTSQCRTRVGEHQQLVADEPVEGPITPNFPFGPSREIAGDYVKK